MRPCVRCAPLHPLPSPLVRSTGSATLQLGGRKKWTLIPGDQSYRLRPSLAPDGRAFFCTRRAHGAAGVATLAAAGATHYEVEQRPGDVLWVPTWTWHRVDYLPNVTALLPKMRPTSCFRLLDGILATIQGASAGRFTPFYYQSG